MSKKIFIVLLITFFCIIFIYYSNSSLKLTLNKSLSDNVKKYVDKSVGVELSYVDGNNIYGHFYNSQANNIVLETKGLFSYNIKTSEFVYYGYEESKRIMTFYLMNNIFYYVILEENGDKYHWELAMANEKFNNVKRLKSGNIESPLNYPRILYNDKNSIYFLSIDDINEEKQQFQFDLIKDSNIFNLKNEVGNKKHKEGNLLFNISNVYIEKNYIYYTIVDENSVQYLKSFNVINQEETTIYENKDYDKILYNYKVLNDGIYIQLALKNEDNKSYFVYIRNNDEIINKKGDLKTLDIKSSSCIIFHNQTNSIEIFSEKKLRLYRKNVKQADMYPKYLIVNDKILMQDFSNQFYLSGLIKKICN